MSSPNVGGGNRGAVRQIRFLQDAVHVILDRGQGNEQAAGDLLIAEPVCHQRGNFTLPPGKHHDATIRPRFRHAQDDHRLAKTPGRSEIDRQAAVQAHLLGQGHEFLHRKRAAGVFVHGLYQLAQADQRTLIDPRRIAVHHVYPRISLTERTPQMPVKAEDRKVVEDLLRAMQTGPSAFEELLALFADDGVLVEPFTGTMQTHTGKPAIRASLNQMAQHRTPDLTLKLDRVDMDGGAVRAEWTCTSKSMPGPMRGYDLFTIRGGKISRLEIVITEMPAMRS